MNRGEIADVLSAARRVRRHLVFKTNKLFINYDNRNNDLAGFCGIASFMICCILDDFTLFRQGRFWHTGTSCNSNSKKPCSGHEHAFVQRHGIIVDATATQFGRRYSSRHRFPAIFVADVRSGQYTQDSLPKCRQAVFDIAQRLVRFDNRYGFPTRRALANAFSFYNSRKRYYAG